MYEASLKEGGGHHTVTKTGNSVTVLEKYHGDDTPKFENLVTVLEDYHA